MCFSHILSLPSSSPRFSPPPYSPNFISYLSRSKNKTTLPRKPPKLNLQNRQKPNQNRKPTKNKESVLCWPMSPLNVVDIPRITALERTDVFLSQLVSVANRFLVRNETLCPFSILFHAGISFGLYLWGSYRCCHRVSSYCISPVLSGKHCFLGDVYHLQLL